MISPQVLPQFLGKHRELFDILIIDEASQMKPEDALSAIVRSKKLVVVGDDQQLPPTDFFQSFSKEDTDYENEIDRGSILDLAGERLANKRTLRWHYRSRHESLIQFSNHYFYKNKLLVFPSPNDSEEDFGFKNITVKAVTSLR